MFAAQWNIPNELYQLRAYLANQFAIRAADGDPIVLIHGSLRLFDRVLDHLDPVTQSRSISELPGKDFPVRNERHSEVPGKQASLSGAELAA